MSSTAAIIEPFSAARIDETVSGLLAAEHLRRLRLASAHSLLGKPSLSALLAAEIPNLDRAARRGLLSIIDAFRPGLVAGTYGLTDLAPLGLTRLLVIASAPAELRAEMIGLGPLPVAELRRWARTAREARDATALRRHHAGLSPAQARRVADADLGLADEAIAGLSAGSAADRLDAARASISAARRYWRDTGSAIWNQGRIMLALETTLADEKNSHLERSVSDRLGIDRAEMGRLAAPVAAFPDLSSERAGEIGLAVLRALAEVGDVTERMRLLSNADNGMTADELLEQVRLAGSDSTEPRKARQNSRTSTRAPSVPTDDPARRAVQNLFFAERDSGPQFADQLPAELMQQIILRTTAPGDHVWDPMAGAGATLRAAEAIGRSAEGSDLLDPPIAPSVSAGDARQTRPTRSPALTIIHPPLPLDVIYSERYGARRLAGDLSGMDPDGYRRALGEIMANVARAVPKGGWLVSVSRESRRSGVFLDWPAELAALAKAAGLTIHDRMYAPLPIEERAELVARNSFRARAAGELLPVVWTVLFARRNDKGRAE